MVEAFQPQFLRPIRRGVTGLATRGEAALVRVGVAIRAFVERKPYVLNIRFRVGHRLMAFFASDRGMRACERIF